MRKKFLAICCLSVLSECLLAQGPGAAFNPMTAPGAKRISIYNHILYWQNPPGVVYNEVFASDDSLLVANLNPSVKVLDGYPTTVYSSMPLNLLDTIINGTKYYWRVVEYNQSGNSIGNVWWFRTKGYNPWFWEDFSNGLNDWEIIGPSGLNNWIISSGPGMSYPCLTLNWSPQFNGQSYIMLKKIYNVFWASGIFFHYEYTWAGNGPRIGIAYTLDEGSTWNSIWEIQPTTNIGPTYTSTAQIPNDEVQIGFYFIGNSLFTSGWHIDDVVMESAIVLLEPPSFLNVNSDSVSKKATLTWNAGASTFPDTIQYYKIERKVGTPTSPNVFEVIAQVNPQTFAFSDTTVSLNSIYTYRIRTGIHAHESNPGNDATVYVPAIVPVELVSFIANVFDAGVSLNWTTASETNNRGFEIDRKTVGSRQYAVGNTEWEIIGFVEGRGTTTETQSYSFVDDEVTSGNYHYRLKQIDFDGSYEYSNVVEISFMKPTDFSLEQNYPNPFNPTTMISWQSPVSSHQTLKIFDVLGNEVATLVDEFREAGRYEMDYNASNLSSGIYYYQLISGDFITTKKMLMLK